MAVGHFPFPQMHPVPGVRLATTSAGIKTEGRQDLVVMEVCAGANVAGVFTNLANRISLIEEFARGTDLFIRRPILGSSASFGANAASRVG